MKLIRAGALTNRRVRHRAPRTCMEYQHGTNNYRGSREPST